MVGLGEIMRGEGLQYLQTHFMLPVQRKAMSDIAQCRTAALGTVSNTCDVCEEEYWLFCSCRNRSCPLCQGEAQEQWLRTREEEMLPVPYLHMVFTLPRELKVLARYCPEQIYNALIRSAGQAVIDVGRSKLHLRLGTLVELQTWDQNMGFHPHAHAAVPAGGFSEDGTRWVSFELKDLPAKTLANRFRTLLCRNLLKAERRGKLSQLPPTLSVEQLVARVKDRQWEVYAQPPFGGTRALLEYLARYTHRVAITNERIVSYEDHQVTFKRRSNSPCTLDGQEFWQRFLMHVPPKGFVRIRSYGFLGNRKRKQSIESARRLIGNASTPEPREPFTPLRLCPVCAYRRGLSTSHYAPAPEVQPQFDLQLRPPPKEHVAA
jgi:hypothetical protein